MNKNQKMVAEFSVMLITALGNTLIALVAVCFNNNSIDNKLSDLQKDLFC